MFFWKKKKNPNAEIREVLFGDLPYENWEDNKNFSPFKEFLNSRDLIEKGDKNGAIDILKTILEQENLESRHYLQVFHYLKELGVDQEKKILYGVVIEVSLGKNKTDILAAYSDMSARYYNYSGSGVVWENPDDSLEKEISDLLEKGESLMDIIGPWDKKRLPLPATNITRINLLTSQGLHFGEGPFDALMNDNNGRSVLESSTALMQALMNKSK